MSDRPLSLIEILVAEYEEQCKMNPSWPKELAWPPEDKQIGGEVIRYNTDEIKSHCLRIETEAAQRFESSAERCEYINQKTDELVKGFYRALHNNKDRVQRAALCFSGGGIRSATFVLGLLQGLAGSGVGLSKFHYVSTVSGGGYIGSWLSAWIHRQGIKHVQRHLSPLRVRREAAGKDSVEPPILPSDPEAETIQHLRRYSNYMSPKLGLLSADTWTLVAIFLRNLLLNWTVLIPLLLAALTIPRMAVSIASWNRAGQYPWAEKVLILAAFLAGVFCMTYMVASLPSWRSHSKLPEWLKSETWFLRLCWLTLTVSAFFSAAYWAWVHIPQACVTDERLKRLADPAWWQWFAINLWRPLIGALEKCVGWFGFSGEWIPFVLFGLLFHIVGYLIARVFLIRREGRLVDDLIDFAIRALTGGLGGLFLWAATLLFQTPVTINDINCNQQQVSQAAPAPTSAPSGNVVLPLPSLPARIEVSVTSQPVQADSGADAAARQKQQQEAEARRISTEASLYVTFGPSLFLAMFLIAATLFIGFASVYTNDADREWLSRSGGWMLITIFGWSALCGLVIFGPVGLVWLWHQFKISLLSVGAGSGLLTLIGGFSSKTGASKKAQANKNEISTTSKLLSMSLPLAATVFVVLVLASLSLATSWLISTASQGLQAFSKQNLWWHLIILYESPADLVGWIIVPILLVGLLMGFFININKFSLHSAYRDRLIRAYLGASNNTRQPNPFTGFDELDNVQMHNLLTELFRPQNFDKSVSGLIAALHESAGKARPKLREVGEGAEAIRQYIRTLIASGFFDLLSEQTQKLISESSATEPQLKRALADEFNRVIQAEDLLQKSERNALKRCSATGDRQIDYLIELIKAQPSIPLFPFKKDGLFGWLRFERDVEVQKLLINRKLIEITFEQYISSPSAFKSEARPLHMLNIALNLVGGKELAWQERKAQPFTVSPLHAGSYGLGYRDVKEYAVSRQAKGALSLGTSLAISGAAVSPNMGYNSSSAVTFLLTLFNVRLGWWLGNPGTAGEETYTKPSPFFAPKPLIAETLGMTDSEHPYVYLSDGAHFENLALYEMVRRRCHYIIVSDAGSDCDFKFDDLGNALRKIRIDQGIPIEFLWDMPIQPRVEADKLFAEKSKEEDNRKYCALARIKYSEVDGGGADGWLIYIKPTVYGVEPPDVQNYAKANDTFPHETTGDQMYSESQFESYRALGEYVIRIITEAEKQDEGEIDLETLLGRVKKYLGIEEAKPALDAGGWEGDGA